MKQIAKILVLILATFSLAGCVVLPPCAEEDSQNCYWDASERGNGIGRDFIDINGQVIYI